MNAPVLVAGIGNIFSSDDAFGVEVANRLMGKWLPSQVRVADFGIRGVHLAYELLDGYECLILIDAVELGEAPGTIAVIEPERFAATGSPDDSGDRAPVVDAHNMSPDVVLGTLAPRRVGRADLRDRLSARESRRGNRPVRFSCRCGRQRSSTLLPTCRRHRATRQKGSNSMITRLVLSLAFALAVGLVVKSLPDIARYLKIREM